MASNTILADIHELFSLVNMFVYTKINIVPGAAGEIEVETLKSTKK